MSGLSVGRMLRPYALAVFACLLGALSPVALAADRIELNDGSIIYGSFPDADGGKVTM